jgi:AraC family transcriptional regulator
MEIMAGKKMAGKKRTLSFSNDTTAELWKSFMPRRKEIHNNTGPALYSINVYSNDFFTPFHPGREFQKWAAVEVTDVDNLPAGIEFFILPAGLYAVFLHKGSDRDTSTFEYIFTSWLPHSGYVLDNRPHVEKLGEKYKNGDPASEEEIWIPVRPAEH